MRIKIDIQRPFIFEAIVPIRIGDINYGYHLGNDALLGIIQEARLQFYRAFGFKSELDIMGTGIIMADVGIQFKAEGHYGMKLLVKIAIDNFTRVGYDLYYQILDAESDREIARAKTGIVTFDYDARKVVALPEGFKALLEERKKLQSPKTLPKHGTS